MNSSVSSQYSSYFKIVFLGDKRVGKTSIINRIFDQEPIEEYLPTFGIKFHNLEITSEKKYYLQLWDTSGNEIFSNFIPSYMENTSIVILVFDYKNEKSQSIIEILYDRISEYISSDRILIIGNKFEKEKSDIPKFLNSWFKKYNVTIIPVSALENRGITIILRNIVKLINDINKNS